MLGFCSDRCFEVHAGNDAAHGAICQADVTVRQPRDFEGPACRMLLPDLQGECLIAAQEGALAIVGAASFRPWPRALIGLRIRVIRTHRRRGIGSLLLRRVLDEAAERNAGAVLGRADGLHEPDAPAFLAAHGFRFLGRLTTIEADVHPMRDYLVALRARLRMPANVRLMPVSEAPCDQVARLYAEYIAHQPDADSSLLECLHRRTGPSPVLMLGDRVVGMLLSDLDGPLCTVHARVVAPGQRGGWVNALLLASGIADCVERGGRRVRFEIPHENRDTEKLALRFGAETVSAWDRYALSPAP